MIKRFALLILLLCLIPLGLPAAELSEEDKKLLQMKPEELLNTDLTAPSVSKYWEEQGTTSVSKKGEDPFNTPAAVYIISAEDIKRSGVTSVMEALRMAPGVQVARIDSNKWAISIRGFNRQFSDKIRVMVDGRPVYTNLFSGVFWDDHDIPLDEVERIEVIRGSGGVIWGTNSFNGIVNIITKRTKDTQGDYLSAIYGNEDRGNIYARHGGKLSDVEEGFYRTYIKTSNHSSSDNLAGDDLNNDWHNIQGGFRIDATKQGSEDFSLKGDVYRNNVNNYINAFPSLTPPFFDSTGHDKDSYGASISSKLSKPTGSDSYAVLQADLTYFNMSTADFQLQNAFYDLDFEHFSKPTANQELTWGLGHRFYYDKIDNSFYLSYDPDNTKDYFLSSFVQDKIWLMHDFVSLTLGSKFEYYDKSGFDYQPSVRITLHPDDKNTFWAAISKVTKFPTRGALTIDREILQGTPFGYVASALSNRKIDADKLMSYEIGYRTRAKENLFLDFTVFFNDYYDDLVIDNIVPPPPGSGFAIATDISNEGSAHSYGFESSATWQVTDDLRIEPTYSFILIKENLPNNGESFLFDDQSGYPNHQFSIRSQYNITSNIFWDSSLYYVDSLNKAPIPDYFRLDTRLAWKPIHGLELSIAGQNLLDDKHQEDVPEVYAQPSTIGRSVYVKAAWEF